MERARLLLLFPLLAIDVLANFLLAVLGAFFALDASMVRGSWDQTLSARAGLMAEKHQPYFAWTATAIDKIFGSGHCARQLRAERMFGSAWTVWAKLWRQA